MTKRLFSILLLTSLALYTYAGNITTVSVNFHNAQGESVKVCLPPCDYPYFANDTISTITNDSTYQFNVDINKAAFMYLMIDKRGTITLLLQPKEKITLDYDFKAECPYTFTGKNATGQYFLNKWMQEANPYKYEWIKDYTRYPLDTIPEKMDANFQKIKQQDIAVFDSLYKVRNIDKTFRNVATANIEFYYLATLSRIARNASEAVNQEAYYHYWDRLYKQFPLKEMETDSPWFSYYADLYIANYLEQKKKKEGIEEAMPTNESEYYQYTERIYHDWTSDKRLREMTWGTKLFLLALNNKTNSTALLPMFEQFKTDFPNNVFVPVFERYAQEINSYQKKIAQKPAPEIRFLEQREELKTLQDVFDRLKGKYIFVDFWFSTCGPCRAEFKYAKQLEAFLKENQIELLYISIDNDRMEENWINSIKYFDLYGWHVRVPHCVHVDMDQNYGIHSFPTYMLVDKEGNVIIKRAKEPSEKEELYKQIQEAIKQSSGK